MKAFARRSRSGIDVDRGRRIVGLAGILVSGAYLYYARELSIGELTRPGAGLFPILIGGFSLFVSVLIVLRSIRGRASDTASPEAGPGAVAATPDVRRDTTPEAAPGAAERAAAVEDPAAEDRSWLRAVLLVVLLIAYVAILPTAGFIPTSIGFVFLFGLIVKRNLRLLPFAVYSVVSVFALYYLFTEVLLVRLP